METAIKFLIPVRHFDSRKLSWQRGIDSMEAILLNETFIEAAPIIIGLIIGTCLGLWLMSDR